ncbi:hypothetical protein [Chryseobacterium sp. NKUCC03_KSP]|uniref:hypothetical protein n=1 Tax=Chryseobacterium sp. NKUCC03_KSP TaxID=2842125 RepID=UPI001C5AAA19|nr:hypothetical protein [Chryseobacterium sp. NKUCC03_KSP]MBW3524463.1 hypothetical protein [Chryseobacterium sp. NKUCC03_KSP]
MKKSFLLFLFISSFSFSQINLSNYTNGSGKVYNIDISQQKFINVQVPGIDNNYDDFSLKLSLSKAKSFKENLIEVKNKYAEWKSTAAKNEIKEFHKKLNVKVGNFDVIFKSGRHHFLSSNVELFAELNIDKNGTYLTIANTKELVSTVNQFITSEGFLLYFHEAKDIESFIESIDLVKADELIRDVDKFNAMFK